MNSPTSKNNLYQQLAEGKTHQVIAALLHISDTSDDADFQKTMLLQSAQVADWQRARDSGTLTRDELQTLRNRIHIVLITWMDTLPADKTYAIPTDILEKAALQDRPVLPLSKNRLWLIAPALVVLLGIGWFLKSSFSATTFTQTFIVHDAKGNLILNNQGKVILDSKFGLDSANIHDNGEATMNLATQYVGEQVKLRISHPQPYQVVAMDSTYILAQNAPIQLVVALRNLDKIEGEITDELTAKPLDGVRVSIQNVETFTDKNGWFSLLIPSEKQAQFQRIALDKKGYRRETFDDVPIHTKKELRWMMKRL